MFAGHKIDLLLHHIVMRPWLGICPNLTEPGSLVFRAIDRQIRQLLIARIFIYCEAFPCSLILRGVVRHDWEDTSLT